MELWTLLKVFYFSGCYAAGESFGFAVPACDYYLFPVAFDLVELHGCVAFWSWHGEGLEGRRRLLIVGEGCG
jgi:hypothetical protein